MTAATLPTFADVLAETKATARKSDLGNLAHVHVELNRHKLKLQAEIAEVDATVAQIEALGASEDATTEAVNALYTKARALYQRR